VCDQDARHRREPVARTGDIVCVPDDLTPPLPHRASPSRPIREGAPRSDQILRDHP